MTSERADERQTASTQDRIVAAAIAEFGSRGYAGARTASIAARAGVNAQLITYYFGGKRGLLAELRKRWAVKQADLEGAAAETGLQATLAAWLEATWSEPEWSRLVIWQALEDSSGSDELQETLSQQREQLSDGVSRMRARQHSGEIIAEIDPEFVMLLAYAVAFAPIALPHVVSALFGEDPESYRERWVEQLVRLVQPQEMQR